MERLPWRGLGHSTVLPRPPDYGATSTGRGLGEMTTLKKNDREQIRALAPVLVLAGLVLGIGALRPSFLNWDSLIVTVANTAILFILAAGSTFVVMLGSIDLSIQAICSFASVIVAVMLPGYGYAAIPVAGAIGVGAGAVSWRFSFCVEIFFFFFTRFTTPPSVCARPGFSPV